MPNFDRKCVLCDKHMLDCLEPSDAPLVLCPCGGRTERLWIMGRANSVTSDECDVWVSNGICNPDGSPRRYRHKSEMAKEAAKHGLVNHVEHIGSKGSDRNKHTSRWV